MMLTQATYLQAVKEGGIYCVETCGSIRRLGPVSVSPTE